MGVLGRQWRSNCGRLRLCYGRNTPSSAAMKTLLKGGSPFQVAGYPTYPRLTASYRLRHPSLSGFYEYVW